MRSAPLFHRVEEGGSRLLPAFISRILGVIVTPKCEKSWQLTNLFLHFFNFLGSFPQASDEQIRHVPNRAIQGARTGQIHADGPRERLTVGEKIRQSPMRLTRLSNRGRNNSSRMPSCKMLSRENAVPNIH